MLQFVLRKLVRFGVVLIGVALLVFLLMHLIPGSPWDNYSGKVRALSEFASDRALQQVLDRHFGFDLPLWRQFTRYMFVDKSPDGTLVCGAICGNLGPSTRQRGRTVEQILFEPPTDVASWKSRAGYSVRLVFVAALLAVGLGAALGLASVSRPRSLLSRSISVGLAALISIPSFVIGLLLIILLATRLQLIKVLPDWNQPSNWIVPAIVLALMPMASIARVTRASIMNVQNEDYVRTAHGKGLPPATVLRVHVLRNALVPILTFLGPALMEIFTALLIVENLYAFPGFGREFWEAALALDYPMIMGLTLLYTAGLLLINLVIEIACEMLDPRLRMARNPGAP
jgi:oligopeptide transport system permease protein